MNSRIIKNQNQEPQNIEVIRYFSNNDNDYLIYSLNENDDAGYTKLYASKIIGNAAKIISNDEEWLLIKEIIKDVVKSNRDGGPLNIIDLNENNLENITLEDTRAFKLQGNLVNLLAENKQVEEVFEELIEEPEEIIEEKVEEPKDFEMLYENELTKVEMLENKIELLSQQLQVMEQKLQQIKELVQE